MTENGKKFLEKASQDEALKAELQSEMQKAQAEAVKKIAASHGFNLTAEDLKADRLEALSEDELKAVAGGGKCYCIFAGGGTGEGRAVCACPVAGAGVDKDGEFRCTCGIGGYGDNEHY